MSKTGMSLEELEAAKGRAQTAYWYAYMESIKNDVPKLLELAAEIEKRMQEIKEAARENPDAEEWANEQSRES